MNRVLNTMVLLLWFVMCAIATEVQAGASPNAISYQGSLKRQGTLADGTFDFEFSLWNAQQNGAQIGPTVLRDDVPVAGGVFQVELDFGAAAFEGNERWLQVGVRASPGGGVRRRWSPRTPGSTGPARSSGRPGSPGHSGAGGRRRPCRRELAFYGFSHSLVKYAGVRGYKRIGYGAVACGFRRHLASIAG